MRIPKLHAAAGLLVLVVASVLVSSTALAQRLAQGLAVVSSASPFLADCNGPAFPIVAAYINAEVEPDVAVNPRDPNNLIAVYQEDRYPNDGANGVLASVSFDGGHNWHVPALAEQPPFSRCAGGTQVNGGDFEKASDPWISFGPDGTAYFAAVSFNVSGSGMAEFVSTSTAGGRTWSEPVAVIRDSDPHISDERPAVTADPAHPQVAYLVWDRQRTAPRAEAHSDVFFSRTADGGKTWSTARSIYATPIGLQTSANQIVVLPNGELVNVFNELKLGAGSVHPRHDRIAAIRSTDGGRTWSRPVTVARSFVTGVADPLTHQQIRVGDSFTSIAVDPRPGTSTIYAAWGDARFTSGGTQGIAVAKSTDGGRTWSTATPVATNPGMQDFVPSVAVNAQGIVAVTYYSFDAGKRSGLALPTWYWVTLSDDGSRTWTPAERVTPEAFDLRTAPFNSGFFLGEYQGLAGSGQSFIAVTTFTNGRSLQNRTDIFACVVTPGFGAKRSVHQAGACAR